MEITKQKQNELTIIEPKSGLALIFEKWMTNHISKGTQSVYSGSLKEFASFCAEKRFGFNHPSEINPTHIIQYRDWLLEKENSNKTINRKLSALSSLFKEMRFQQVIKENPAESVRRVKDDIKKVRTSFKDKEIKPILDFYSEDSTQGLQNKTLLTLFAYTAQRVSTIRVLRVKDIKIVDGMMVLLLKIKGGKQRQLPIGHEPARLIHKILEFRKSPEDYLFTAQRGPTKGQNKPISSVGVFYLIKKTLKAIGQDESKSAHSFRRAVLTKLLNTDGLSAEKIREEVSFHSSLDTLNIYKMPTETKMTENPILGIVYSK